VPVNTIYKDGLAVGYDTEKLKLTQRPVASLWASKLIPIPPIKTGTTLTIPIIPSEAGYLFPGHLDLIRARGGHIFDDDWSQMYMDGDLTITVEIVGKDIEAISWNEVFHTIDGVEMKTTLPNQYDGGYLKRRRIQ